MPSRWIVYSTLITLVGLLFPNATNGLERLTVADFMADPFLYDAEFSPNGRYLALIVKQDDMRVLVIRDVETKGFPVTGRMKDNLIRPDSISWANNERLLVNFLVPVNTRMNKLKTKSKTDPDFDIDKYEMAYRTLSMDVAAKNAVVLMGHKSYSRRNSNLSKINNFLIHDDKHVIIPAKGYRSFELHKVNVYTGKAKEIVRGNRHTYEYLTDENGHLTYRFDYYHSGKKVLIFEYTADEDWEEIDTIYFNQDDEESFNNEGLLRFGFGDNHDLIYRERNQKTGFYEIVLRQRGGKTREVIASLPNKDIHSPIFDSRTDKYLGYRIQDDLIRNVYTDEKRQLHYNKIASGVGHSDFSVWASRKNRKRAIIKVRSSNNPGSFYVYDYENMSLTFLDNKYSKMVAENLAIPVKVSYRARDGETIRMYILFPREYKKGTPSPMVILPHGGPHIRDSSSFDRFAQFISTRGYIVIQPNFRGSSGYGQQFEEAGYRQWGGVMQDDLTDAVNFMVEQGYGDSKRVCIVGGSYGGYAALMGAINMPNLYQCSVSINGVTHLKKQIEYDIDSAKSDEERIEKLVYKTIGHPKNDSAMLDANSPTLNVKSIKTPILVIAGEKDEVVPVEQSEMMVAALEKHQKDHEYFELEDAGHNVFYYKEDFEKVYKEVERFLGKYLKD